MAKRTPEKLKYHREYMAKYLEEHPRYRKRQNRMRVQRQQKEGKKYRVRWNSWYSRVRDAVIDMLGAKCACCGEKTREFLSVDHIHGGGAKHRKASISGGSYYQSILKEGCPANKYRVLCYNCNCSLGHRGYCPHQTKVSSEKPISRAEFKGWVS